MARRALTESGAEVLILELLEWWPAWLITWARAGLKVIVVDGRVSPRTLWAGPLLRGCARQVTLFLAQTEEDAKRARTLGVASHGTLVCGDAKHDSAHMEIERASLRPQVSVPHQLSQSPPRIILGCIRPRDEEPALVEISRLYEQLRGHSILIAPRHIERVASIQSRATQLGLSTALVSELPLREPSMSSDIKTPQVLILDSYGALASCYKRAHVAIIGGTFFDQGQNLIEAALAGCAVVYGPRGRSLEAQRIALRARGGYDVTTWREALTLCLTLCERPRAEVGVDEGALIPLRGALARQLTHIIPLLERLS